MVTVSAISIIPECLTDDSFHDEQFHMIPIFSSIFFMRLASFVLGGALYFALSWAMNVPEPEELLEETLGISHANESHLDDGDIEIQPFIENDRGQTSPSSRMKKGEHADHMGVLQPPSPGNNGKNKTNKSNLFGDKITVNLPWENDSPKGPLKPDDPRFSNLCEIRNEELNKEFKQFKQWIAGKRFEYFLEYCKKPKPYIGKDQREPCNSPHMGACICE